MAPIVAGTLCPFAVKARMRGAPAYDEGRSLRANLEASVPAFTCFTEDTRTEELDAFVYRFPRSAVGDDINRLARLVRTLVEVLLVHDPVDPRVPARRDILAARWRLSFAGVDYFAPVFSPVYGKEHSRYTYGVSDSVFVLMQPNSSFHTRLGSRATKIRGNIRSRFEEAGQPYPSTELEAHKFVLPLNPEDNPVNWYDLPPFPRDCIAERGLMAS
ncbi:YqcI/YcgG family protein [Streptomyces sp. NBC_01478]|uniref:YqcI/YcgG family protein n=1 Tax=Streptomyces sp. NBC_01478 TaxID=2903882 RepID=UPI002E36B4DE|nr:YqcI/YcgG family protein [Streptomyces sp. NBC_01478]